MNYTLITGAGSGMGAALAKRCAAEGFNLILLGRNEEQIRDLKASLLEHHHIIVQTLVLDLLSPDAAAYVHKKCHQKGWVVRILINNAGLGQWGMFEQLSVDEMREMLQLNQSVLVELCHFFIPMLKEVPYAHILNVASTAAFQPTPYFSVYAASKSFTLFFSQSLRYELRGSKVNVSCLCPGPTDTPFFDKVGFDMVNYAKGAIMQPKEVADVAIRGLMEKKAIIVPGFSNSIGAMLSRHFPRKWMVGLIGKFFKP
jgi:short-subunit dehydrogenase